ncbi:reverse transcriptase, partial [Hamiltosporidium magnivora]
IALNKEYGNNIKATWIDVKKAYDSIDHAYLTQCIENLNLPDWTLKFIKVIISKWRIDISIDRVILQGYSLSPLLFVLCMDPLSRKLNEKYTSVAVQTDAESLLTVHLLFIDDLKLFAKNNEAKEFSKVIELEINKEKSATNDTCCDTATLLEGISRLYLTRTELGRGLHSVELRSEHMLLQFFDCLEKSKEISIRRAAISRVENNNKTHLALIKGFLKVNYRLVEEVTKKSLEEA